MVETRRKTKAATAASIAGKNVDVDASDSESEREISNPPPPRKRASTAKIKRANKKVPTPSPTPELDPSESEQDYKPESQKPPPAKRVKISTQKGKGNAKRGKCLSLLPTMPMDILFEIFASLAPKDLLALSRTNHDFRNTLLAGNATGVWKRARRAAGGVPPPGIACPMDDLDDDVADEDRESRDEDNEVKEPRWTEARWAALLYDPICNLCGKKGINTIDFALRKRVCKPCKRTHLETASVYTREHRGKVGLELFELLPYTRMGGRVNSRSTSQYYWVSDIEAMIEEWDKHTKDIKAMKSNAVENFAKFKADKKKAVQAQLDHATMCDNWRAEFYREAANAKYERQDARSKEIIERFTSLGLGYIDRDVYPSLRPRDLAKTVPLSDEAWPRLRQELEKFVTAERDRRYRQEFNQAVCDRTLLVESHIYKKYLADISPRDCPYQPSLYDFCQLSPLKELIYAPKDQDITIADIQAVEDEVTLQIPELAETRRAKLVSLIPDDVASAVADGIDPTDLATTVFLCTREAPCCYNRWLPGWESAGAHHCKSYGMELPNTYQHQWREWSTETSIMYSEEYSAVAKHLVEVAGLNPVATLPQDMDKADKRFFCGRCPSTSTWLNGRMVYGRSVHTWREAILHEGSHHIPGQCEHKWVVMTEAQRESYEENQFPEPSSFQRCWACNHCSEHLNGLFRKDDALLHLRVDHDIHAPQEPTDLFIYPNSVNRSSFSRNIFPDPPSNEEKT